MLPRFQIVVGTVGVVFCGDDFHAAGRVFDEYCALCFEGYGRPEYPVVFFDGEEIIGEDFGPAEDDSGFED